MADVQELDTTSREMLRLHALNGAQRLADGAGLYAENLRYDYLIIKNQMNLAQSVGVRHVEESGSGRVRVLDSTLGGQQPAK